MYTQSNYEDAYYKWYSRFGGCELEPEERGQFFYNLIMNADNDEDACCWAGVDYESEDYEDDLEVAKKIAWDRMDDTEFALSMDWTYGG